jgi:hypothetical protein
MSWKKKEKPLTPEEAIDLARKELAPFWFGVEPMFAAVKDPAGGKATAHPLEKQFFVSPRLIFFFDPLTHSGTLALMYAREWRARFKVLGLEFLFVIRPHFGFVRQRPFIQAYLQSQSLEVPAVVDHDGALSEAFGADATRLPKVLLLSGGQVEMSAEGKMCFQGFEERLHEFLRKKDPGLALAPTFDPADKGIRVSHDSGTIDFGATSKTRFASPGFQSGEQGHRIGVFAPLGEAPPRLRPGEFALHGTWIQDGERIATNDSAAAISIRLPASGLSIITESQGTSFADEALIQVLVADRPAWDGIIGEVVILSEEGRSVIKSARAAIMEVLHSVRESDRLITLKFPTAKRVPVALYSLRFSTSG